jgi:hypothetical protein
MALVLLWVAFLIVRTRISPAIAAAIDPSAMNFLSLPTTAGILLGGMIVGCTGGLIAARSAREIAD